jgi:hypothetical protein
MKKNLNYYTFKRTVCAVHIIIAHDHSIDNAKGVRQTILNLSV